MKRIALIVVLSVAASAQTYQDADALFQKALKIGVNGKNRDRVEPLLAQSAKLWEVYDRLNPEYAQVLVYLGLMHQTRPHMEAETIRIDVEPLYRKAVEIHDQKAAPADPADVALALEMESDALVELNDPDEAKPLKDRAIAIRKQIVEDLQKDAPAPSTTAIRKIGKGISPPVVIQKKEPQYSDFARIAKRQGSIVFDVVVGPDGSPYNIRLLRSLGYGLDEQGLRAIQTWRFQPGKDASGQAVAVQAQISVNFRLL